MMARHHESYLTVFQKGPHIPTTLTRQELSVQSEVGGAFVKYFDHLSLALDITCFIK